MGTPRQFIEDILGRHTKSDPDVLDSLTGAIDRLQKAFPRYGSFLMEFIQNADDAESAALNIEIIGSSIKISNNGKPFSEENVKSICKVGRSSKTPKDYIGYLGVGFKSSFLISDSPEIRSGGFNFKFDRNAWPDPTHTPWQVMPIWIDDAEQDPSGFTTVFKLPVKDATLMQKIRAEIKPEELNDRMLLFLKNINEIEITDKDQNFDRKIVKSLSTKKPMYEIYRIAEYHNGQLEHKEDWLLFRRSRHVPTEVKQDYVTRDWERDSVETREVVAAFRLNDDGDLTVESKGTAYIGVFSFLPLKEVPSGLNFLIQGDFLTTPGRGELARESLWNDWLAKEIYELIIEKCIPAFAKDDKWKFSFTQVLFSDEGGHELFGKFIKRPLREYVASEPVLVTEDGSLAGASDIVQIWKGVREFLTAEDIQAMFPGKKVMHEDSQPHSSLSIERSPFDVHNLLSSPESEGLLKRKADSRDVDWFKRIIHEFVEKYTLTYFEGKYSWYKKEHDQFWNKLRTFDKAIILTDDYHLARIGDCVINPKRLEIPEQVKTKFNIVHPELIADPEFLRFVRKLNEDRHYSAPPEKKVIRAITEEDIRNVLKEQEIVELSSAQWERYSDAEKMERLRSIKELWERNYSTLEGYGYITIRSKDGIWRKPEELFFSKEYKPEHHNLDVICNEKKLCDLPIHFVSSEFIYGESEYEVNRWREFLEKLGVDKQSANKTLMKNIVQRIGILTAIAFERSKGRQSSRELSRSEETGGYDIRDSEEEEEGFGIVQSSERYIEVKSRKEPNPDIFLTPRQFAMLHERQEKYFVYVVKDALGYPTLSVTRGDRLAKITGIKAIIPFNKWSSEAKEEDFQP